MTNYRYKKASYETNLHPDTLRHINYLISIGWQIISIDYDEVNEELRFKYKREITVRPFNKAEKTLIANSCDGDMFCNCSKHGLFAMDKDNKIVNCPTLDCDGSLYIIKNIDTLRQKYKHFKT